MSRRLSIAARSALILFAVALEAVVAYFLITAAPANLAALLTSLPGFAVLALHVVASMLLAAGFGGFLPGGSAADRASVVVLYFLLAFILPGAGMGGVALLSLVLGGGGKQFEAESEFKVGNPLLAHASGRREVPAEVHLEPLAASLREVDTAAVRRAVLALRERAHLPAVARVLRRFRGDADSEVQFFAQSALGGAMEKAERRAAVLAGRVGKNSGDIQARVGRAAGLVNFATDAKAASDRRRLAGVALEHLTLARKAWPNSLRVCRLTARAHLLVDDPAAAREVLMDGPASQAEALELLIREGSWDELRTLANAGAEVAPELAKALAFWADEGGEDAA